MEAITELQGAAKEVSRRFGKSNMHLDLYYQEAAVYMHMKQLAAFRLVVTNRN